MSEPRDLRRELLAVGVALAGLHSEEDASKPLRVTFRRGKMKVKWKLSPDVIAAFAAEVSPLVGLTPQDRAILDLLAESDDSLMGKEIAAGLQTENDQNFRKHLAPLAPLRSRGLVDHTDAEGYYATELARRLLDSAKGDAQ